MNKTTIIATVEDNHTIHVPASLAIGERVMIIPLPSIERLLHDPDRRARFVATRKALDAALKEEKARSLPSNEEVV